jgi:hypothetical protein
MRVVRPAAILAVQWLFLVAALTGTGVAGAQPAATPFTPREEKPEDFPDGPGRDDAFYNCTACHGFKLIAQQGQNRRQWEDTINLMMAKHNMPPLDAKTREAVLNYLEATYPPRARPGWQNPFLNR